MKAKLKAAVMFVLRVSEQVACLLALMAGLHAGARGMTADAIVLVVGGLVWIRAALRREMKREARQYAAEAAAIVACSVAVVVDTSKNPCRRVATWDNREARDMALNAMDAFDAERTVN